jgi:hypothetical protein
MTGLLILVKDNINNTYSIYDNKADSGFKNCIEFLEKKTLFQFKNVIIDDKICELFIEKKNTQKGWIWNTDITDAIKMYTLSFITMLNKTEMVDKDIQITPIPIITKNSGTFTGTQNLHTHLSYSPINYFQYEINEDTLLSKLGTLPSKLGTLPSNITCQIPCRLSTASVKVSQQPKVFKEETKKGNRDYSLNDKLITELKQHLNTTNYGLRRRKRRYD